MSEALGRALGNFKTNHSIKGIQLFQEKDATTNQQFVDDTMLYVEASIKEAKAFKNILQICIIASGQEINLSMSEISF